MLLKLSFHWTESLTLSLTSIQRMSVMCLWGCWPANRTKVSHSTRCSGSLDVSFLINHLRGFHRIWQRRRARGAKWVSVDFYSMMFAVRNERKNGRTLILACVVLFGLEFKDRLFFLFFSRINVRFAALWTVFLWQKPIMLLAPLLLNFSEVDSFLDVATILFVFLFVWICVCLQSRQTDSHVLPQ